jgi:hypothetical protein
MRAHTHPWPTSSPVLSLFVIAFFTGKVREIRLVYLFTQSLTNPFFHSFIRHSLSSLNDMSLPQNVQRRMIVNDELDMT